MKIWRKICLVAKSTPYQMTQGLLSLFPSSSRKFWTAIMDGRGNKRNTTLVSNKKYIHTFLRCYYNFAVVDKGFAWLYWCFFSPTPFFWHNIKRTLGPILRPHIHSLCFQKELMDEITQHRTGQTKRRTRTTSSQRTLQTGTPKLNFYGWIFCSPYILSILYS